MHIYQIVLGPRCRGVLSSRALSLIASVHFWYSGNNLRGTGIVRMSPTIIFRKYHRRKPYGIKSALFSFTTITFKYVA